MIRQYDQREHVPDSSTPLVSAEDLHEILSTACELGDFEGMKVIRNLKKELSKGAVSGKTQ